LVNEPLKSLAKNEEDLETLFFNLVKSESEQTL
jgi:hypothetical protein